MRTHLPPAHKPFLQSVSQLATRPVLSCIVGMFLIIMRSDLSKSAPFPCAVFRPVRGGGGALPSPHPRPELSHSGVITCCRLSVCGTELSRSSADFGRFLPLHDPDRQAAPACPPG